MNPTNLIPQWQFDEVGKFLGIQWVLPEQYAQNTQTLSEKRAAPLVEATETDSDGYSKAS